MKNKLKWVIAVIVLVLIAGVYSIVDKTTNIYNSDIDNSEYQAIELIQGDSISQSFVTKEKRLNGVELKMSAVGETENINIHYEIQDETGNVLVQKTSSLEKLKNGKFYEVKFDELRECRGRKYTFLMQIDTCSEENKVTVYDTAGRKEESKFTKNDGEIDGTLVLRTTVHRFDLETFIVTLVFLLYVVMFLRWLGKLFK